MTKNTPPDNLKSANTSVNTSLGAKSLVFFRKNWVQNVIWVVLFLIVFLALRPFMQGDVIEGQVPYIQTESITSKAFDVQNLQKPYLIHFWATWCPICDTTQSGIEALAKDFPVINVATQSGDNEYLLAHAKENGMNPDLILNDKNGDLLRAFGARAVPASFIIDGEGNIRFIEVGFTTGVGLRLRFWWLNVFG